MSWQCLLVRCLQLQSMWESLGTWSKCRLWLGNLEPIDFFFIFLLGFSRTSLYCPVWPGTCGNPFASASWVLRLRAWTTWMASFTNQHRHLIKRLLLMIKKKIWEEKQRPSRKSSRLDLLLATCFYPTLEWEAVAFLLFLLQRAVYTGDFFFFKEGRKPFQLLSSLWQNSKQF